MMKLVISVQANGKSSQSLELQTCRPLINEYQENDCLGRRIGIDFELLAVCSLTNVNTSSQGWIEVTGNLAFLFAHGRKTGPCVAKCLSAFRLSYVFKLHSSMCFQSQYFHIAFTFYNFVCDSNCGAQSSTYECPRTRQQGFGIHTSPGTALMYRVIKKIEHFQKCITQ